MGGPHRRDVLNGHLVVLGLQVIHAELSHHQVLVGRHRAIERRLLVKSVDDIALRRFL